jgi:transcriptional regulator GlxA family with amidase domain
MDIVIPIYDDFTALDAIGPYEVLSRTGGTVRFIAKEPGPIRTDNGMLSVVAEASLADYPSPEIVVVPGGVSTQQVCQDAEWVAWLRGVHETSTWTTSVCTGSLLLGAAGILDGLEATSHWLSMDELAAYGASPTGRRVVRQGKVITAAGVSSGIDMGLVLAAELVGEQTAKAIQLMIEYDPEPPYDCGSVQKAGPAMVQQVRDAVDARRAASRQRAAV